MDKAFEKPWLFKAMLNSNFKEATQDKIELKGDNSQAIMDFLKLMYSRNMLLGTSGKVVYQQEKYLRHY